MMAMCLEKTGNIGIIRDWVMSISDPYDRNNAGETEADNLGQTLYLVSLFSDESHPVVKQVLKEISKYETFDERGKYIKGRSDFHETPVYQTKWLKYGLSKLGFKENYVIPEIQDDYGTIFWWAYKDSGLSRTKDTNDFSDPNSIHSYPYLGWAADHFHGRKRSPVGDRDYPLSWERNASQANYLGASALDPEYLELKLCAPHTWHAAEMFLYLLALDSQV